MSFKDKVVLVTGGSSGIGAATAIKFVEEGAQVAIVGRNKAKLQSVSEQCEKSGNKPLVIIADVSKDEDVKRIINETIKKFGKLDVLVNNAGIGANAGILSNDALETFDRVMATNLRAVVYLTNLAVPYLVETKGNIINISSNAGIGTVFPAVFVYSTSKAALDHFTRCIALELAPKEVRVNAVNPGPVKTDIVENIGYAPALIEAAYETMRKGTALGRIAEADEVADLVTYIASDKARSITGTCLVTDNGLLLKGCLESYNSVLENY